MKLTSFDTEPVFFRCFEKPTQNDGMKPKSIGPRVFYRFAIGRPWSTRLFALLGKALPKWWYKTNRFRSQGCFFVSPRWGKSIKRVLNAIGRPSSTRLLSLLGIAHPKWWYETDLVEFDRKGVFSFRPDRERQINAFWTQLDDLGQPGFLRCLEKPTQNGGIKPKSWNSIPRVFFRFAPMGKVDKTCFERNWTTFVNPAFCAAWKSPAKMVVWNQNRGIRSQGCFFVSPRWGKSRKRVLNAIGYDLRQPSFLGCLEKPTQNGGMKLTSWNSIPRVFYRFAPMGKVQKTRFERNWTTFVNPAFIAAWNSPPKMVVWNRNRGTWSQGCFFVSPRWGKSKKTRFERNWTTFVNPAFCAAWKSPPKMVVWNQNRGIRSQGCFFVSPRSGKSKKRVLNAIGQPSSTRLLSLLGIPTQNGGMKPTLWNSKARVFFRFAPMGKSNKRVLNAIGRPFVNQAFIAAWNSPPKMVVWNRPRGIRSQRCFFVSPQCRKNAFWTQLDDLRKLRFFALLGKAHPKWWYETEIVEFDRKGVFSFRPDGESRKNAFWTQLDDLRQPGFLRCLEKPTQNGGKKPKSWNSVARVFFRFAPMGKVEKTRFERNYTTFVNPAFCAAWKSPTQNGGMKPKSWNSIARVFFRFPPMGKVEKTRFERNYTTFVNPAFCAAWKSPPKWWYETEIVEFGRKGVFSFRPDGESRKNAFWTQLDDLLQPGFFALLGKAHPKWWYETEIVEFDRKRVFSFRPDGESRKTRFERNWTTFFNPAFCAAWKSQPKMGGIKPNSWNSIARVFFRFAPMGKVEKTRFERNSTTFFNPAFCAAWKSQPKMVVWDRNRAIR